MPEPSMNDKPRHVRITCDGVSSQLQLDGADVTAAVRAFTLEHRVMQAPLLVLYLTPQQQDQVAFEGVAHVVVGDPAEQADPADVITAFLQNIDPAALDQAALNREDLDDEPHCVARATLAQLADWAQGKAGG